VFCRPLLPLTLLVAAAAATVATTAGPVGPSPSGPPPSGPSATGPSPPGTSPTGPSATGPSPTGPSATGVAGPVAPASPAPAVVEEPFPIRRLRATEEQLAELGAEFEAGPLVRLPRVEFEARVRAAGRAVAESRNLPRISDIRLKASLVNDDLQGSGEFDIVNPAAGPRWLPLEPMRLALRSVTWADGPDVVIGIPSGEPLTAVRVEASGRRTLRFDWSAVGVTEPGERRFDLRIPVAPTASLDLELPADRLPAVAAAEVLLTGPFPAAAGPSRSLWRLRFGGRSRLELAIRPAGNPGAGAVARLVARYDLAPRQLSGVFEYDVRSAKGAVGTWGFTVDPGLRVTDVVVNNRGGWSLDAASGAGEPRRLRVDLRQPGVGGKVLISVVAPYPDPGRPPDAPLPMVRPTGADLDEETLELRFLPGTRVVDWDPGDYRITDTQTLPDQTRIVNLSGTLVAAGADRAFRRSPTVKVLDSESELTVSEQTTWRLESDRAWAQVRVGLRVKRGPLFQFALRQPAGYRLVRVTSVPEDAVAAVAAADEQTTVQFGRPLLTGQAAELVFEFDGPRLRPGPQRLAFPAFAPRGAAERHGVLGVAVSGAWVFEAWAGVGTTRAGWFDPVELLPPPGTTGFRYRGCDPDGWVELTPAVPEFDVEATRSATAGEPVQAFTIRVRSGWLPAVVAVETGAAGPDPGEVTWRTTRSVNAVDAVATVPVGWLVRGLGLVAAGSAVPARDPAAAAAATVTATTTAARDPAAAAAATVTATTTAARDGPSRLWLIRFTRPVSDEVRLEAVGSAAGRFVLLGAREYRTGPAADTDPTGPSAPGPARLSGAYLVTAVRSTEEATVVFGGTVSSSGPTWLPITLPPGAELRSAVVGRQWVNPRSLGVAGGEEFALPVPAGGPQRFEVRYRLRGQSSGGLVSVFRSPVPQTRGDAGGVRRWWLFAPEVLPGWPVRPWEAGGGNPPELLGDPVGEEGQVVSESEVEEVRVGTRRSAAAVGIAGAVLLFLFAWFGGRRRHPGLGLLVALGLLVGGGAFLLGPPWWQRAAGLPLVVGLVVAAGMVVVRGNWSWVTAAGAVVLAATLSMPPGAAQPPGSGPGGAPINGPGSTGGSTSGGATVVILPAGDDGQETVVAPKAVLDRLAASGNRGEGGAVIVSAEYAVVADEANARVRARFVVHAPEGATTLAVPLAEARLEGVSVNGTVALPTATRPGTYTVPLGRAGRNELEVRFSVSVTGTGPEREVRFGVPEVAVARLSADLPGTARQAQVVGRLGRQSLGVGERVRLEADLGAVKGVVVRWRDGAGGVAAIKVREGCVWDVTESGATLTACYVVRVEQGTITSLRFDVPPELDVLGVTVRPLEKDGTASLQDWSLPAEQGGVRPLRLDFQGSVAGRFLVVLSLSHRKVVTRQPVLRFPRLVLAGGRPASVDPDAAYGFRVRGVTVEGFGTFGAIDFSPDALTRDRDFADVGELWLGHTAPVRVFRPVGAEAELRPTLRPATNPPGLTLETHWQLAPYRAEGSGSVRWNGKDGVALLEFNLPGVTVNELRGAEVASWSQAGPRVLVWLRRLTREGELVWSGTVAPPSLPFDVVTPRPVDGTIDSDVVVIKPVGGGELGVERDRGWTAGAAPFTFRTTNPLAPPVRVTLAPARPYLRAEELGWLAPQRRPAVTPEPPRVVPSPPGGPTAPAEATLPESPRAWVWPVSAALGWAAAVLGFAFLFVRLPRTSWPEQFALVAGLFGAAVAGGWSLAAYAWGLARLVWLVRTLAGLRLG